MKVEIRSKGMFDVAVTKEIMGVSQKSKSRTPDVGKFESGVPRGAVEGHQSDGIEVQVSLMECLKDTRTLKTRCRCLSRSGRKSIRLRYHPNGHRNPNEKDISTQKVSKRIPNTKTPLPQSTKQKRRRRAFT
ncbi:hypothetical protein ACQCVP_17340 [Rossellomorea vietnamensis]|uniref:hypothetical protein n=1 Tax=Rossellomorea vietnamensis TaxID=218284 RepID=UPI003CF39629